MLTIKIVLHLCNMSFIVIYFNIYYIYGDEWRHVYSYIKHLLYACFLTAERTFTSSIAYNNNTLTVRKRLRIGRIESVSKHMNN